MIKTVRKKASFYAMAAAALALMSAPAIAGFEWTAQPPAPSNPGPNVIAAPSAPVDSMPVGDTMLPPPGMMLHRNVGPAPVLQGSLAAVPAPAPVTEQPLGTPFGVFETVSGFGSDIPLALAMNQVVPGDYAYSFDPGVNPGLRVSWSGEKPWNQALSDAVAPYGLSIAIAGKTVRVKNSPMSGPAPYPVAMPSSSALPGMPVAPAVPAAQGGSFQSWPGVDYMSRGLADQQSYSPSYPRRQRGGMETPAPAAMPESISWNPPSPVNIAPEHTMAAPVPDPSMTPFPPYIPPGQQVAFAGMGNGAVSTQAGGPIPLVPITNHAAAPVNAPRPPMDMAPMAVQAPMIPAMQSFPAPNSGAAFPAPNAPAVLDPFEIHFWEAAPGESLRNVLGRWSAQSGVELVWGYEGDFPVPSQIRMHGTFSDAIAQILSAYPPAGLRPAGQLYPNLPMGPSVLVVNAGGTPRAGS